MKYASIVAAGIIGASMVLAAKSIAPNVTVNMPDTLTVNHVFTPADIRISFPPLPRIPSRIDIGVDAHGELEVPSLPPVVVQTP